MTRAVARLYRKYALDNAVVTLTIATRDPNECRVGVMRSFLARSLDVWLSPDSGEIADISQPSLRAIPDSCIAANRLYSVGAGLFGQTRFAKSLNQQLRV